MSAMKLMQKEAGSEERKNQAALRGLEDARYQVPVPAAVGRAWRVTEALIAEARRHTEQTGARFGLVVVPNKEEILNAKTSESQGLDYQQSLDRTAKICERLELRCLQLLTAFREADDGIVKYYWPLDAHWTKKGHAVVANETVAWLSTWAAADRGP